MANIVRACSYDAVSKLVDYTYESGRTEKYLEVKYRVDWFNAYCKENNIEGYIDDSDIRYVPEAAAWIATATVYMDGKPVGKSSASKTIIPGDMETGKVAVQTACTFAKGRALANAGFGTTATGVTATGGCAEDGEFFTCDGGVPVAPTPENNPLMRAADAETKADKVPARRGRKPAAAPEQYAKVNTQDAAAPVPAANTDDSTMSVEKARATVVQMGQFAGKTLGELALSNLDTIEWYASDNFNSSVPANIALKEAAKVLLDSMR